METKAQKKEQFYQEFTAEGGAWKIAKDALQETAALKKLSKHIDDRLKAISDDAVKKAEEVLQKSNLESGRFEHKNQVFELSVTKVFDFVEHPQRYTMAAGVRYRQLAKEKAELSTQMQAKTKLMNALMKNFAADNPEWEPDKVQKVIKFIKEERS